MLFGGAVWGSLRSSWQSLFVPRGAVGDLVDRVLRGDVGGARPALLALVAWTAAGAFAAQTWFRWEPRG